MEGLNPGLLQGVGMWALGLGVGNPKTGALGQNTWEQNIFIGCQVLVLHSELHL